MTKLYVASIFTLGVLFSFVFCIVNVLLIYTHSVSIGAAIGATIVINVVLWRIGPWITDWINKTFYQARYLSKEDVMRQYPEVGRLISEVSAKYQFPFPKLGIIADKNPTAYSYGSGRFNSRIVVTEGLFKFLDTQEACAVVAHELGHIVNRDFIVMMIASTLLQILYEVYAMLIRAKGKSAPTAKAIAVLSYALYVIGIYLLYYLSRTREYLADDFSAQMCDPADLANALIKIAYGIVSCESEGESRRQKQLLQSTRHLGIVDVEHIHQVGITSQITGHDPTIISETMVFDRVNPWAFLIELRSTHPLTGKRIDNLNVWSKAAGRPFPFDVDAAIKRLKLDRLTLYRDFCGGVFIMMLPYLLALLSFLWLPFWTAPAAFGIGLLLQISYKFPHDAAVETTILDEMRNPMSSPIRGRRISLSGRMIGRGDPGYVFGADMEYQDSTGLIFLEYVSAFGFIGNLFFALRQLKEVLGVSSQATGWFYRGMGSSMTLEQLKTDHQTIRAHPVLWPIVLSLIVIGLSGLLYALQTHYGWR